MEHAANPLACLLIAAASPATAEVERWFDYPMLRLGDQTITVLTIAKIVLWIGAIVFANVVFQRMILRRLLKHTRLHLGLQFAIAKIFGYFVVFVCAAAARLPRDYQAWPFPPAPETAVHSKWCAA